LTSAPPDPDTTDRDTDDPEASPPRGRRSRWPFLLGGLALLLAVASGVLGYRLHQGSQLSQARQAALAAARQEGLNLASVSQQTIDADLERVLSGATGDFRTEYAASASDLRNVVTANQVTSTGQVIDAALVEGDRNKATALVVIDAIVKNREVPKGATRYYRMQLVLTRQGNTWLTSTLQLVG